MGKDQAAGSELSRLGTPLGLEKVGSQFLSLRQLSQSRIFSAQMYGLLNSIIAAIFHLSSGLLIGQSRVILLRMTLAV
jgi:hypothetical protein